MKIAGYILMLCAVVQVGLALPDSTVNLLCPAAGEKKANPLRSKLKSLSKNLDVPDSKGKTALMLAAEADNRLAVCYLVSQGVDVTLKDKDGKTAVDYTRNPALRELLTAAKGKTGGPAVPEEELRRRAQQEGLSDVAARNARLWQLAARPGSLAEIAELMLLEVDLNAPGPNNTKLASLPGLSPEYLAYFVRRGYTIEPGVKSSSLLHGDMNAVLARLLLALGLEANTSDFRAMLWSSLFEDDVPALEALADEEEALTKTRLSDNRSLLALAQSAAMVKALVQAGADPAEPALLSDILARGATDPRSADVVQALLEAGAPLAKNMLPILCSKGNADARTIRVLTKAGADAKAVDDDGNTLLHLVLLNKAAQHSAADALRSLIKAGANPKAKNKEGQSALQLAKTMARDDLVKAMSKNTK